MATEPKINQSKYQNSLEEQPKIPIFFFQLWLQPLIFHMFPSLWNIIRYQCQQYRLLIHIRGCWYHNQHQLIGCRRKPLHPNHHQPHRHFRTRLLQKLERKPKRQPHPMIVDVAHSVQEYYNIDRINMSRISKLMWQIILEPSTFYSSKRITYTTKNGERKLFPHSSLDLTNRSLSLLLASVLPNITHIRLVEFQSRSIGNGSIMLCI